MESTLLFWEYMIEAFTNLIVEVPFIYLRQIRQDVYWTTIFKIFWFLFLKTGMTSAFFDSKGKVASNMIYWSYEKQNSEKISMLPLIISTGLLLSWQPFLLSWLCIFVKILFFVSKIKEKFRTLLPMKCLIFFHTWRMIFILFNSITTGSVMSELWVFRQSFVYI